VLSALAAYNAHSKNIPGRKEEKKEGKKKGTKEGRKEGRKERRKEGKKEGLKILRKSLPLRASGHVRKRKKNTVAILAQGTSWADAISQAFFSHAVVQFPRPAFYRRSKKMRPFAGECAGVWQIGR
jgi:hypothetical protein